MFWESAFMFRIFFKIRMHHANWEANWFCSCFKISSDSFRSLVRLLTNFRVLVSLNYISEQSCFFWPQNIVFHKHQTKCFKRKTCKSNRASVLTLNWIQRNSFCGMSEFFAAGLFIWQTLKFLCMKLVTILMLELFWYNAGHLPVSQ